MLSNFHFTTDPIASATSSARHLQLVLNEEVLQQQLTRETPFRRKTEEPRWFHVTEQVHIEQTTEKLTVEPDRYIGVADTSFTFSLIFCILI